MAKVSFTKLVAVKAVPKQVIELNGEKIEIIQYLPMSEKGSFLNDVLNAVLDSHGMGSNYRQEIYSALYLIKYYTNINLTETMMTDATKTYDHLVLNGILTAVREAIPVDEYTTMMRMINESINIVSGYRTSLAGMFFDMQAANQESAKDASEIMKDLESVAENPLLQDIMKKLG